MPLAPPIGQPKSRRPDQRPAMANHYHHLLFFGLDPEQDLDEQIRNMHQSNRYQAPCTPPRKCINRRVDGAAGVDPPALCCSVSAEPAIDPPTRRTIGWPAAERSRRAG